MKLKTFRFSPLILLLASLVACTDKPQQVEGYTVDIAPREALPSTYVALDNPQAKASYFEGFLRAPQGGGFNAEGIFSPEVGIRIDSTHVALYRTADATHVGFVVGSWPSGPRLLAGITLAADGTLMPTDTTDVARVRQVEKGRWAFAGAVAQREVHTRGPQGGVLTSTKTVVDTTAISAHVYPNGDLFIGRLYGDLGTPQPDMIEGYYFTTAGETYRYPQEKSLIIARAKAQPQKAEWSGLLALDTDMSGQFGSVATDYDTPPFLNGQPATTMPITIAPYAVEGPGHTHTLTLRFLVNTDGRVTVARTFDTTDQMAQLSATELVRQMKFVPARKAGRPVKAWVERKVSYRSQF